MFHLKKRAGFIPLFRGILYVPYTYRRAHEPNDVDAYAN